MFNFNMNLVLSYEDIVNRVNSDLINKLRKHGSEVNYLNLWFLMKTFKKFWKFIDQLKHQMLILSLWM